MAQLRDARHPDSEDMRSRAAAIGAIATKPRSRQPHSIRGRARSAGTTATPQRSATTRRRTGRDPATTGRAPIATVPAGQTPPGTISPARSRSTIAQSVAISPSNADNIRQSQTNRSHQPSASAASTTPPTAPRSALRLEREETAVVVFILQSAPRQVAEHESKHHQSRRLTYY